MSCVVGLQQGVAFEVRHAVVGGISARHDSAREGRLGRLHRRRQVSTSRIEANLRAVLSKHAE